jgi:hypothetical protein
MGDQILVLVAMLLAFAATIGGASYVYAITAEREPRERRPPDPRATGTTARSR